ncbi:MAG TPA: multicopper oxidase domain-containing protein [Terriglobales bacterium]|nr:multicopper oxidase domain-containing protein [Terriglobales bacterium]
MKYRALLAVALLGGIAAVVLLVMPGKEVSAYREPSVAGHGHHRAPRGSDIFQYRGPQAQSQAGVYDPEVPPPTPAPNGVREFTLVIHENVEHEVAPGVKIPAWAFNGKVPGPVLRATEGDLVKIKLVNRGTLPHTIHFHGVHPAKMDGVFELVPPGGEYTYEFIAQPYGIMPYHCHAMPTSQHIHNGLYGMLIVDPKQGRKPMRELAMVMSAFDLDRDGEAEFYAWNARAFQYANHPIQLAKGEPVRMYVLNMFEEAMVPHLHGNLYHLYPTGTSLKPTEYTDVKTLNIAERAILEFQYDFPGTYMFQCHVSEHMEQGLMGWFEVVDKKTQRAAVSPQRVAHGH